MTKPMLILRSDLTKPPQYYATRSYTVLDDKGHIRVTGKKWDVTEQIERLIEEAGCKHLQHICDRSGFMPGDGCPGCKAEGK